MAEPAVLEFRAMSGPCRVIVDHGAHRVATAARDLVDRLERAWTRFLPTSEVSALNRAAGNPTVVSDVTYRLISNAAKATQATGGLFNPLMLEQLKANGYYRPWDEAVPVPTGRSVGPATTEPIVLYPEISAVRLPPGCAFDPGGIGKGLAIDMVVELCMAEGSASGCVELGGDLKVFGTPWYGDRWKIAVADPFDSGADVAFFTPERGAVTTSTTQKRSWTFDGERFHHLLDPTTGRPAVTDVVSVTTCSEAAWWAEIASKSALIVGSGAAARVLSDLKTPGAFVTADRRVETCDGRQR